MTRMLLAILIPLAALCWFADEPGNARAACAVCITLWMAILLWFDPPNGGRP